MSDVGGSCRLCAWSQRELSGKPRGIDIHIAEPLHPAAPKPRLHARPCLLPCKAGARLSWIIEGPVEQKTSKLRTRATEMRRAPQPSDGRRRGVPPETEALLNVLRPYCMSVVMAMEELLNSGDMPPSPRATTTITTTTPSSNGPRPATPPAPTGTGVAARVSAGRRLESCLASLRSALNTILSTPALGPPSPAPSLGFLRRAFPAALPFVMLPLELALSPPGGGNAGDAASGGGGKKRGRGEIPAGAREKALLCVAEAVQCSGSGFVEGYRVKPTMHLAIRLVITLSECSPINGGGQQQQQQQQQHQQPSSSSQNGRSSNGGVASADAAGGRGSGLSAGADALRLACLQCLEAVLRAPFATGDHSSNERAGGRNTTTTTAASSSISSAWFEVRNDFNNAAGGGILAQLVQELLLCCQQGGHDPSPSANGAPTNSSTSPTPSTSGAAAARGWVGTWGGPEEARTAARCLEALCSFSPGAAVWRRLLPGTFSGLFRTIRGVRGESGAGSGGGGTAPLGFIRAGPQGVLGGGRRGGGGGSKSALAEACLEILAKVLVMCCGGGEAAAAIPPSAAPGDSKDNTSTTTDSNNPLLALQRLAVNSNASSRATQSEPTSTTSAGHPAGSTAAAAAAATVIAVDDPQWESRTSDRLRLLLPPLLAFCCLHPGWLVRRATARLASDLLLAGCKGGGEGGEGEGLLGPLAPLLMEALVGLLLDGMPQVSAAARDGLDAFRATLAPLRWLELRGVLLERLCAIAEGLPALAKSADEKRLRAAFDLLAGYLSLLRFDARAALDGRLSLVLSSLCEALEFDQDFNVQVLEGSSTSSGSGSEQRARAIIQDGGTGSQQQQHRHHHEEELPRYYRQVFVNVRQDSTLSSARRAVALLGKFCDLPSLADAVVSSLETRPPRPPPPASSSRRRRQRHDPHPFLSSIATASSESSTVATGAAPVALDHLSSSGRTGNNGNNDAIYRQRCLKWLRLRLPLAWVLNQAFLGRAPGRFPSSCGGSPLAGAAAQGGDAAGNGGEEQEGGDAAAAPAQESFLGRGFATSVLERLLASHSFSLPVSRAEAAAAGYSGSYGNGGSGGGGGGRGSGEAPAIEYTRSGAVLGGNDSGGGRSHSLGVSGQVLDANATLVSTVMEALGSLAEASGQDCGEAFLRRALYPLLEKVASPHPVVSQAALATLSRVRLAFGDSRNMSELLEANMDYIVDDVVRRVSSSSSRNTRGMSGGGGAMGAGSANGSIGIPSVVEAVLRIGGSAMGPALVRDLAGVTLREVDACAWDPRQTRRSLGVLRAVASCVTLPLPPPSSLPGASLGDPPDGESSDKLSVAINSDRAEKTDEEERHPESEGESGGVEKSELAESPWFRQLFVEFADAEDIRRVQEDEACLGAGRAKEASARDLVQAAKDHREAMGFDFPDDETVGAESAKGIPVDNKSERLKQQWREIEEETKKSAGRGEGGPADRDMEEEGALPEPDAEGRRMAESEEVKTLSEVLARSCHFLATPSLETQALALACMRDCVVKLASAGADAALLPHVHRAWRPLMASLREHLTPLPDALVVRRGADGGYSNHGDASSSLSSRKAVLLHALDTVDALVQVCGDFLASKVSEDLWPLLKLLLLQYAASQTPGKSGGTRTTGTGKRLPQRQSALFSSSSPSLSSPSSEGLFLVGGNSTLGSAAGGISNGNGSGSSGGLNSLLVVPPGGSGGGGGVAAEERPRSGRGGGSGGRAAGGTLGEKVVARALECLESLCSSQQCERFMTPLAREVALAALPCLSSAGAAAIRSRAEALFRRLSFLDGDSVWLLLIQTIDAGAQEAGTVQKQQHQQQRHRGPLNRMALASVGGTSRAGNTDDDAERGVLDPGGAASAALSGPSSGGPGSSRGSGAGPSGTAVGSLWWLPLPPSSQAMVLSGGGVNSGRPTALMERRSLFGHGGGGRIARECVPAAERLLASLGADGTISEHM